MRVIPKLLPLVALLSCLCLSVSHGQFFADDGGAERTGGMISFPGYRQKFISSEDELPEAIRHKLDAHLRERLGAFVSELHMARSYVVDLDELHRLDPFTKEWPNMGTYFLYFAFSEAKKGIALFEAEIRLDAEGDVVTEIELPNFAVHPEKTSLLSRETALRIAASKGYLKRPEEPKIDYDPKSDSFVWRVTKIVADQGYAFTERRLLLNAHTGEVIRTEDIDGMR
jgi:hypothetical protein